jgi:adenylosuccinate synthase
MGSSESVNKITIIQGAQWGSEAKGAVAAALCELRQVDFAVRTGTVNAGHTVIFQGKPYKMQQLPTGWAVEGVSRPELIIGPGAYIHPWILAREIDDLLAVGLDVANLVTIDYRCGLHLPEHTDRSSASGRHHSMGATGKGCSEAVIDKIKGRGKGGLTFHEWMRLEARNRDRGDSLYSKLSRVKFADTSQILNRMWDVGAKILIEGTQGTFLDLHLGPYPYTTHKQTQVGNWMAECGLSPSLPTEIVLVARTYPIRVAGNSGPMPKEISWVQLSERINEKLAADGLPPRVQPGSLREFEDACETAAHVLWKEEAYRLDLDLGWEIESWTQEQREQYPQFVSELHKTALEMLPPIVVEDLQRLFEMTTVTNKLRRVAELDVNMLKQSVQLNRPAYVALTFANYIEPAAWDRDWDEMDDKTEFAIHDGVRALSEDIGAEVRFVSTGAETKHVLEVGA